MTPIIDRRVNADDAKLSTQRFVTYVLLLIFTAVAAAVFAGSDQAERSTVMQTVINFTMIAVGFWLGSSKGSMDKDASISRIAEATAPVPGTITTTTTPAAPVSPPDTKGIAKP